MNVKRNSSVSCVTCALALMSLGLWACAATLPRERIEQASDSQLFEQMRWVNRGPDSASFGPGGREGYVDALREEILSRNPDWASDTIESIRNERVELGMTKPQVVAAIGWPREYPWWDAQRRPIGIDGDDYAYWSAVQDANRWTYSHGNSSLRVWFRDGRVYRIMDQATGRIEPST